MNVVIIEDEVQTAWDIRSSIENVRPSYSIVAVLDHVESSIDWFLKHPRPDLVISDIKLGDGLSFDIFQKVPLRSPIIFCTAYNEYAMEAFRNNGVDYLLKPVNEVMLERSLSKIEGFIGSSRHTVDNDLLDSLRRSLQSKVHSYRRSLLVSYRSQLIPVQTDQIALFSIEDKIVFLYTFDGKKYQIHETLDQVEEILHPDQFFRANRQFILSIRSIKHIEHSDARKLLVETGIKTVESIVISKAKSSEFLRWVETH